MESSTLVSLLDSSAVLKVSSTLEKATGKKHLIDGSLETCWTSQQGLPQHIQINFPDKTVYPKRLCLTFQGGFVGTRCRVEALSPTSEDPRKWQLFAQVFPEDVNRQQDFDLAFDKDSWKEGIMAIRLVFEESSDFFGRVTIYDLKLEGTISSTISTR